MQTVKDDLATHSLGSAQVHPVEPASIFQGLSQWLKRTRRSDTSRYASYYRMGVHLLLLPILFGLQISMITGEITGPLGDSILTRAISAALLLIPVYVINVSYFIPRFLTTGRYGIYLTLISVSCGFTVWLIMHLTRAFSTQTAIGVELNQEFGEHVGQFLFVLIMFSTVFEMILHWEAYRRRQEQIQKEKVQLELSFLKAQINPHFLFNTLNNIHSMSELKSDKTSDAILMLSDLLRYVLYGTSRGSVPLQKEVDSIENYMAIQRLRISKRDSIVIQMTISGPYQNCQIEPQLLLPFVENAFKHGISYQQKSKVLIELQVETNQLFFKVYNTKKPDYLLPDDPLKDDSGIGLANIRRRLELLYPNKHELLIRNEKDDFEIRLTLTLQQLTRIDSLN